MPEPTVFIVDDDDAVRHCISVMCDLAGLPCEGFPDGEAFMRAYRPTRPGCLVVDQRMPGMSGLELLQWMSVQVQPLPVIVITGHGDVPVAVNAFRGGALDFLEKPFADDYFLERVREAFARDAEARQRAGEQANVFTRYRRLSRRERSVMDLMVRGLANKLIAAELGIGIRTVESHRAKVLKKMGTASLSELTRLHLRLQGKDA
ncbi:two component transcriptional regulatory protein, LuxR family [Paramagnetospirillum caucaseum]|uniref:Two component transcriptional regulatory protein, LuxR family n=1 Tax=Paramagnetospirillum caucaseum TaxID=1244869 RepID=M3AAY5_9PROT|nr:response regulator [Paramagnetospirillum caucaseum]EME69649.1 two component transcriptional regulatory protein, LuxR family [Paramagnetospirillum caucaseum]